MLKYRLESGSFASSGKLSQFCTGYARTMSKSPPVPATFFTEREGVNALARLVNEKRHVWRETPLGDIGIDGQIEHLTLDGHPTALLVALQVKSGETRHFGEEVKDCSATSFTDLSQHANREYWERFPIPVLLVLHHPATSSILWIDATRQLRDAPPGTKTLALPIEADLWKADRDAPFASCGPQYAALLDAPALFEVMLGMTTANAAFDLSFFDLFVNGLTSLARSLYFGMDLCWEIAEFKLGKENSEFGVGLGGPEYDFLDRYVRFLVEQRLVTLDFTHYLREVETLQLQNNFISPLTSRGRELVAHVGTIQSGLTEERLVGMNFRPRNYELFAAIEKFKSTYRPA